jgi:hypothetical protein
MIDRHGTELVHQHHRARQLGLAQQVVKDSCLARSEKTGKQGDGNARRRGGHE